MECFIIVTVLWVFSVCLHEFGHAWAAYQGGDHTVKEKGYLTLNPIYYTEPVNSLILPIVFMIMGGIGLPGGAVYIERQLLRSKGWETWVSLAGPAMHLPIIIWISLMFKFGILSNDPTHLPSVALGLLLQLQVSAVILNLLPIPPLDGFQAIAPWLSTDTRIRLYEFSNFGSMFLFMALWFIPPVNQGFWNLVYGISSFCGVSKYLGYAGWEAFRFWVHD
jgi:Zn-dependent protease